MGIKILPFNWNEPVFPADHSVALRLNGEDIPWRQLEESIDSWSDQIEQLTEEKVAAYHGNGLEFLSILLALWRAGKVPVIPASNLDVMREAVGSLTGACLGQFPKGLPEKQVKGDISVGGDLALIVFTSGSSGVPKAVPKTFAQLNAELEMLHRQFGMTDAELTVGTVSHHHMYGLPFRLLWPLVSGRPFLDEEIDYVEQVKQLPCDSVSLITSPAHLERLPDNFEWQQKGKPIKRVFSAGAPLSLAAAENTQQNFGVAVTDIYGSTETGAVAWRDQSASSSWQPLNGVDVQCMDGCLAIKSHTVTADGWFVCDDLCEIHDRGSFTLIGRADRIIKVGAKRASATAIERALQQHEWVKEARIMVLSKRKSRVGAVIQLDAEGVKQLVDLGNRRCGQRIVETLEGVVERVAWPRYWRFVEDMPVNRLGKTTVKELENLFEKQALQKLPRQIKGPEIADDQSKILHLLVEESILYLQGHFPGQPILPGVAQIGWAIHFGGQLFGALGAFKALEVIKFQQVIRPGRWVGLKLAWDEQKRKLQFQYFSDDVNHASGRIAFQEPD